MVGNSRRHVFSWRGSIIYCTDSSQIFYPRKQAAVDTSCQYYEIIAAIWIKIYLITSVCDCGSDVEDAEQFFFIVLFFFGQLDSFTRSIQICFYMDPRDFRMIKMWICLKRFTSFIKGTKRFDQIIFLLCCLTSCSSPSIKAHFIRLEITADRSIIAHLRYNTSFGYMKR